MTLCMYVCSLVSNKMLRHISVQFLFQMGLLVYLLLIGAPHFGVHEDSLEHLTIIFNMNHNININCIIIAVSRITTIICAIRFACGSLPRVLT